jgi:Spy/CpxP family protein refolding chaperone
LDAETHGQTLNLTEAQQTQVKSILADEKTKIKPMMQQLRQNQPAEDANVNGSFDEAQARAFANKQAQLMTDLIVEKERMRSQVYAVLTPEQRQKALQLMQERQQHRQERMNMKKQAEQKQQSKSGYPFSPPSRGWAAVMPPIFSPVSWTAEPALSLWNGCPRLRCSCFVAQALFACGLCCDLCRQSAFIRVDPQYAVGFSQDCSVSPCLHGENSAFLVPTFGSIPVNFRSKLLFLLGHFVRF